MVIEINLHQNFNMGGGIQITAWKMIIHMLKYGLHSVSGHRTYELSQMYYLIRKACVSN